MLLLISLLINNKIFTFTTPIKKKKKQKSNFEQSTIIVRNFTPQEFLMHNKRKTWYKLAVTLSEAQNTNGQKLVV